MSGNGDPGLLYAAALSRLDGVTHAFETRAGSLASRLPSPVARLRQVHGNEVILVEEATDLEPLRASDLGVHPTGDALITARLNTTIAVATADCIPVLIAATDGSAVAAAHAGWRGLAAAVIPSTVRQMCRRFGVEPQCLSAAIGPCVGAATYRVGSEVVEAFGAAGIDPRVFRPPPGGNDGTGAASWLCDLAAAARHQLLSCGLRGEHVESLDRCTFSDTAFHSYRRDGDRAGRMLAGIALTG